MDKQISVAIKKPSSSKNFNINYLSGIRATITSEDFPKENVAKQNIDDDKNARLCHSSLQALLKKLSSEIILSDGKKISTLKAFDDIIQEELQKSTTAKDVVLTFESMKKRVIDDIKADAEERINTNNKMHTATLASKLEEMEVLNCAFNEKTKKIAVMQKEYEDGLEQAKANYKEKLQRKQEKMANMKAELEKEINVLQAKVKTIEADREQKERSVEKLKGEVLNLNEMMKETVKTHESAIEKKNNSIAEISSKLEDTLRTLKILESENTLALENSALRKKIDDIEKKAEEKLANVNRLSADKDDIIKKNMANIDQLKRTILNNQKQSELEKKQLDKDVRQELDAQINANILARKEAQAECQKHKLNYSHERQQRIQLHNQLLEMQGNIRVLCRVRPSNQNEKERAIENGEKEDITEIDPEGKAVVIHKMDKSGKNRTSKFEFDRVFDQSSSQEEIFKAVQPLCISFLDGFNITIFAYGQTGSGKTYTMEGNGTGISPRCMTELFTLLEERQDNFEYKLTFSMMQIHNDNIHDLLDNLDAKLKVSQTEDGRFEVLDATEIELKSVKHALELISIGQSNRAVASHRLNQDSSRSHSIITINMTGYNKIDGLICAPAKLRLIDLAGSERSSKTGVSGETLAEMNSINKSLLSLGDVVNGLATNAAHVPYRNSKLTFMLKDSLSGHAKCFTIVNISPSEYNSGETICSLNFASRCRASELEGKESNPKKTISRNSSPIPTPSAAGDHLPTSPAITGASSGAKPPRGPSQTSPKPLPRFSIY